MIWRQTQDDGGFSGGSSSGSSSNTLPHIVSVEFLEGDSGAAVSASSYQWVNLPRDSQWVDGEHVTSIDRLGRQPRVRVTFSQPGSHVFLLRLLCTSNSPYSDEEQSRNAAFRHTTEERSYVTDSDGTKIVDDFELSVRGGIHWQIQARDNSNTIHHFSEYLEARRLVYYQVIAMEGTPVPTSFDTYEGSVQRHGLELRRLGRTTMRRFANVGNDSEKDATSDEARRVYERACANRKEPHILAIVFTDHLAVQNANQRFTNPNVMAGPGRSTMFRIRGRGLRRPYTTTDHFLWIDINEDDWFVSCKFTAQAGGEYNIPKDRCRPIMVEGSSSRANCVHVDLSALPSEAGRLEMRVNWVDRMRGGLSFSGSNLILIATRVWWNNKSAASQNEAMVHETGHKLGMVPTGADNGPPRHSMQYTHHGHVGSHCHAGVPEANDYSPLHSQAQCVMFGGLSGHSRFCHLCGPQVSKVDIHAGWRRF
jgi:hypothetical protein